MKKLRWKLQPKETGLRAIGAPPRGSNLHDGEKIYACVYPLGGGRHGAVKGWYWVAGWDSDVPYMNTCNEPEGIEEAKKAAREYVVKHLK